jgi:hypothetical protein
MPASSSFSSAASSPDDESIHRSIKQYIGSINLLSRMTNEDASIPKGSNSASSAVNVDEFWKL